MTAPSRLRALRPWLAVALLPLLLALLTGSPASLLLAGMWAVLVLTVGLAMTSRRPQQPNTAHPRGRLHG